MGSRRLTAVLITLLAAAAVAGGGVPAAGATGTDLPGLTSFGHMAVDGASGHVFVDGAATDSTIDVMNEDGTAAGSSITGETGAGGMVVDGSTLYVARCGNPGGTIDAIDTTTRTVTASFAAPVGGDCNLAEAGGRLWFPDPSTGDLTSVSLDSSHTVLDSTAREYPADLAAVPGHPDWLVVARTHQTGGEVALFDVSTPGTPTQLARTGLWDSGDAFSMAVLSDGSAVVVGTGDGAQELSLPDLQARGWYPMSDAPYSVAVSPDSAQIAAGTAIGFNGVAGYLFDNGDATPRTTWPVASSSESVYQNGLAFDDSGSNILAFTHDPSGTGVVMNVIPAAAPAHVPTVSGFSDMLVDPAGGRVFVSGVASSSGIDVFNPDGSLNGVIDGESGAGGMVVDGGNLYVARCGWGVIDVIDTDTLTRVGSIPAPVGGNCALGLAGGRLWFSDSTDHQWGDLRSVAETAPHTVIDSGLTVYQPIFAGTPVHPSWLIYRDPSSAAVAIEDVTDPSAPSLVASAALTNASNLLDIVVSPSGTELLTASNFPSDIQAYSLPGLTLTHSYPTASYPNAVAVSPSGGQVAGGVDSGSGPDMYLFANGGSSMLTSFAFSPTSELTYARGLAFSADGSRIYAITSGLADAGPLLHVLSSVVLPKGTVSITRSLGTITYGKGDTLTAHLGTSSSSRTLQVWRTPVGGSPVLVHTGIAGAKGNISVLVHPGVDSTYTVRWAGDSGHAAATASVRVNVRLAMHAATHGGYRTLDGIRLYHYTTACASAKHTGCPMFLAWAGPAQRSRAIKVVVQGRTTSGHWVTILHGTTQTGTSGRLLLTVFYSSRALENVPQRVRFSMATSSANLGATSAWVHFRITP